jgi:hypothetical protein
MCDVEGAAAAASQLVLPVRPEDHLDDHGSDDGAQGHQQLYINTHCTSQPDTGSASPRQ